MSQAKVTIIGRPNVGKSSFFNMFVGHKIAIVADEAGTTRDISEYDMIDQDTGISYIVADSGGLDFGSKEDEVAVDIIERTKMAIQESQLLIWLVEYDGFTTLDEQIYDVLRKQSKIPYVLVANKADNETKRLEAYSIAGKGEEMFFPISVSHNYGLKDIKIWVAKYLQSQGYVAPEVDSGENQAIKLAVLGRPNVGKSSLINALVGKDRVMVKDLAGTTRDSVDTKFSFDGKEYILIDTAGIRRLSKIGTRNVENWSVMRSERSLKRADVIAVVMDGDDGVVQQDLHIINDVLEENKGLILVINKWDKVLKKSTVSPEQMMDRYLHYLHEKIDFLPWAAVIFTSAVDRKRVDQIFEKAAQIFEWRHKRVKTSIFNEFIEQAVYKHPPTGNKKSHNPKIYYGSQVDVNPPKFILTVNNPDHFHFSYKRYLENRIRDNFGFDGTPMIIEMRGRGKYKDVVK